ncbi:hypothetical protein Y1Q_0001124 [Alligator mississippiensis]|uniref:Uncharacterized protein n=1 Tax=Alligator mississippiensis TaxID=8496 RepID=A0A151M3X1_ALLMI|nr:hypothetical protein Y1Q_0001124 [Alligator mississippiensis]
MIKTGPWKKEINRGPKTVDSQGISTPHPPQQGPPSPACLHQSQKHGGEALRDLKNIRYHGCHENVTAGA